VSFEGYVKISKFHLQFLFREDFFLFTFLSSSKSAYFILGLFLSPLGVSLIMDNGWKRYEDSIRLSVCVSPHCCISPLVSQCDFFDNWDSVAGMHSM